MAGPEDINNSLNKYSLLDTINLQSLLHNRDGHVMINEFCEEEPVIISYH